MTGYKRCQRMFIGRVDGKTDLDCLKDVMMDVHAFDVWQRRGGLLCCDIFDLVPELSCHFGQNALDFGGIIVFEVLLLDIKEGVVMLLLTVFLLRYWLD